MSGRKRSKSANKEDDEDANFLYLPIEALARTPVRTSRLKVPSPNKKSPRFPSLTPVRTRTPNTNAHVFSPGRDLELGESLLDDIPLLTPMRMKPLPMNRSRSRSRSRSMSLLPIHRHSKSKSQYRSRSRSRSISKSRQQLIPIRIPTIKVNPSNVHYRLPQYEIVRIPFKGRQIQSIQLQQQPRKSKSPIQHYTHSNSGYRLRLQHESLNDYIAYLLFRWIYTILPPKLYAIVKHNTIADITIVEDRKKQKELKAIFNDAAKQDYTFYQHYNISNHRLNFSIDELVNYFIKTIDSTLTRAQIMHALQPFMCINRKDRSNLLSADEMGRSGVKFYYDQNNNESYKQRFTLSEFPPHVKPERNVALKPLLEKNFTLKS